MNNFFKNLSLLCLVFLSGCTFYGNDGKRISSARWAVEQCPPEKRITNGYGEFRCNDGIKHSGREYHNPGSTRGKSQLVAIEVTNPSELCKMQIIRKGNYGVGPRKYSSFEESQIVRQNSYNTSPKRYWMEIGQHKDYAAQWTKQGGRVVGLTKTPLTVYKDKTLVKVSPTPPESCMHRGIDININSQGSGSWYDRPHKENNADESWYVRNLRNLRKSPAYHKGTKAWNKTKPQRQRLEEDAKRRKKWVEEKWKNYTPKNP